MGENSIAQDGEGNIAEHCGLSHSHHFAGLVAVAGKAEDAIVGADQGFGNSNVPGVFEFLQSGPP